MPDLLIKTCNCQHDYQDQKFGKGKRLFNRSGKKDGVDKCSVCNNGLNYKGAGPQKAGFSARPRARSL